MHQYTADLANRAAAGAFGDAEAHLVTTTTLARDRYAPSVRVHTPLTTSGTGFTLEGLRLDQCWRAYRAVVALRPDLVHITGVHAWNVPLVWALRRRGIPVVHTLHDLDPHSGVRFGALIRLWNRCIVAGADHLLVHGERYRQQLLARGIPPARVTAVPLLHLFLSYERLASLSQALNPQQADPPVALFFGRVEAYKGVDTLLDAWAVVARRVPAARLVVAGSVAPGVRLPPLPPGGGLHDRYISDDEALALFRAASLLVLPYRDATQSALVAAAYYFGLPVVVTDAGALPEYVVPGETGWVVPPADPAALAEALVAALQDQARLRAMGAAARAWYDARRQQETATLAAMYASLSHRESGQG